MRTSNAYRRNHIQHWLKKPRLNVRPIDMPFLCPNLLAATFALHTLLDISSLSDKHRVWAV